MQWCSKCPHIVFDEEMLAKISWRCGLHLRFPRRWFPSVSKRHHHLENNAILESMRDDKPISPLFLELVMMKVVIDDIYYTN